MEKGTKNTTPRGYESEVDTPLREIAGVYQNEMLGTRGHAELTHYEERLKMVLGLDLLGDVERGGDYGLP